MKHYAVIKMPCPSCPMHGILAFKLLKSCHGSFKVFRMLRLYELRGNMCKLRGGDAPK